MSDSYSSKIHPSSVVDQGAVLGQGQTWHFSHILLIGVVQSARTAQLVKMYWSPTMLFLVME